MQQCTKHTVATFRVAQCRIPGSAIPEAEYTRNSIKTYSPSCLAGSPSRHWSVCNGRFTFSEIFVFRKKRWNVKVIFFRRHTINAYRTSGGVAPHVLNLGTRWSGHCRFVLWGQKHPVILDYKLYLSSCSVFRPIVYLTTLSVLRSIEWRKRINNKHRI